MEFSRLDDDTIRCVLTEADMKEHGIELEDFFKDKEKIQAFFEEIVEEAKKQVSYESTSGILAVQVMPLPENGLAILFSENPENDFEGIIRNIKDMVSDAGQAAQKIKKADKPSQLRIFSFEAMTHLEQFVLSIPQDKKIKSQLYKDESGAVYELIIEKGRLSAKLFERICEKALEFADLLSENPRTVLYYQEHHTLLIEKNAISRLYSIACVEG